MRFDIKYETKIGNRKNLKNYFLLLKISQLEQISIF